MASQIHKVRFKEEPAAATAAAAATTTAAIPKAKQATKEARAKRALMSLAIAIVSPVSLTLAIIFFFGHSAKYNALAKPIWFPRLWFIHMASLASSSFMGFAAWLVWAEGGFHSQSDALPLYISHVSLSITWNPLVLKIGAIPIAFIFTLVNFGTLLACYFNFKTVNPLAGDLVKPCLAWLAFVVLVTYKLIYL